MQMYADNFSADPFRSYEFVRLRTEGLKRQENAVYSAYAAKLYCVKLNILLMSQLQLEKVQTRQSVTCTIFFKTTELVKQMFTFMWTTVAARTKTTMFSGTGAGIASMVSMRT